jgi:hypothetical protein
MKKFILILSLVSILAVSLVSAGWFSKSPVTGNVVADGTSVDDSQYTLCEDSDGGVFSMVKGVVTSRGRIFSNVKTHEDVCGKAGRGVKEFFCNNQGNVASLVIKCEYGCEDGACKSEPTCEAGDGFVVDTLGKAHANQCNGKNWISFVCHENGDVERRVVECSSRCQKDVGCVGNCQSDTDSENNPTVPGILTVDGVLSNPDMCVGNGVVQFECAAGAVRRLGRVACARDQECVVAENGAGYCRDLYARADVTPIVREGAVQTTELFNLVNDLYRRVLRLELSLDSEETFSSFSMDFGRNCSSTNLWCSGNDFNRDGVVDLDDFVILKGLA